MSALEELNLSSNDIVYISPLADLRKLTKLNLFNNKSLSDISAFEYGIPKIKEIRLAYTNISDVSALANKYNLETVELGYSTPIWDNPSLETCPIDGASDGLTLVCTRRLNELGRL